MPFRAYFILHRRVQQFFPCKKKLFCIGRFNNEIDHYFGTSQLKRCSNFLLSNFWMVENGRETKAEDQGSIPHIPSTLFIKIKSQWNLKHLGLSLNVIATLLVSAWSKVDFCNYTCHGILKNLKLKWCFINIFHGRSL